MVAQRKKPGEDLLAGSQRGQQSDGKASKTAGSIASKPTASASLARQAQGNNPALAAPARYADSTIGLAALGHLPMGAKSTCQLSDEIGCSVQRARDDRIAFLLAGGRAAHDIAPPQLQQ